MTYYGAKEMAESFRTVRKNTIQVAEDIPEDKYSYRAAPDTMSVGDLLAHVAASPHWAEQCHCVDVKNDVTSEDFGKWMGEIGAKAKGLTTKAQILEVLKVDGDRFAARIAAMSDATLGERVKLPMGDKTRFEMLLGVKEHEMHHRAQLFLMQRMIGIVPHLTRARQEAMAQRQAATAR